MGTDRININAPSILPDGAYLNDMSNAKSTDDIVRAAQALRERAQGVVFDASRGQYVSAASAAASTTERSREYKKTAVIAGQQFEFTGDSLENVELQIRAAQAVADQLPAASAHNGPPDDERRQQKTYDDATLNLKFQRGEISVKEYLEQSGAVGEYLASEGISVDAIRETVQQRDVAVFEQSWADAVERFLSGPGVEWPGGSANQRILQNTLVSLGLSAAADKVGALVTVFEQMKRDGTLFPYEQTAPGVKAAVDKAVNAASPEELVAAWKEQFAASGGDARAANSAMIESFRRKG